MIVFPMNTVWLTIKGTNAGGKLIMITLNVENEIIAPSKRETLTG